MAFSEMDYMNIGGGTEIVSVPNNSISIWDDTINASTPNTTTEITVEGLSKIIYIEWRDANASMYNGWAVKPNDNFSIRNQVASSTSGWSISNITDNKFSITRPSAGGSIYYIAAGIK